MTTTTTQLVRYGKNRTFFCQSQSSIRVSFLIRIPLLFFFLAIFPGARLIFSSSNRRIFISLPPPSWSTERRPLHHGISRIYTVETMRSKKKNHLLLELRYAVREMLLRGSFYSCKKKMTKKSVVCFYKSFGVPKRWIFCIKRIELFVKP